jgi:hypothetical protein
MLRQSLSQAPPLAVALGLKFGALEGLPQLLRMAAPMTARISCFSTSLVRMRRAAFHGPALPRDTCRL